MIFYGGIKSKHLSMVTLEVYLTVGLIQDTIIEMALTNDRIFYNISDNSSFCFSNVSRTINE